MPVDYRFVFYLCHSYFVNIGLLFLTISLLISFILHISIFILSGRSYFRYNYQFGCFVRMIILAMAISKFCITQSFCHGHSHAFVSAFLRRNNAK
jgi:hypothetical protein